MILLYDKRNIAYVINVTNQLTSRKIIQRVLTESQEFTLLGRRKGNQRDLKKDLAHCCWLEEGGGHVVRNARGCGWFEEGAGCRMGT